MKKDKKEKLAWVAKTPLYIDKKDDRYKKYCKQLKDRGFSDTETWNLGYNVVDFILPRLKRFKEVHNSYPLGMSEKEWIDIIDKMIFAMEWAIKEGYLTDDYMALNEAQKKEGWEKYKEGMKLFGEYMLHLWW